MNVGFVGLGKIGLPLAELTATRHHVVGYDIAPRSSDRVTIVDDLALAVCGQDLVFVVVSTPHTKLYDGSGPTHHLAAKDFDYTALQSALSDVGSKAASGQTIVIVSTVLPGTTRRELAPLLPRLQVLHAPSFVAQGVIETDFQHGDLHVIGSAHGSAEECAPWLEFFDSFGVDAEPVVASWEEAETIKLLHNTFIGFKIGLVNFGQDLAMRLGHMDMDVVTRGLCAAQQRLLSPRYMKAGMGDGGPCHPRDLIALRFLAGKLDLGYDLFGAIVASRDGQARNLAAFLVAFGRPVLMSSRAYKPEVDLDDGSYALLVAAFIRELGQEVRFREDCETPLAGEWTVLLVHDVDHSGWELPENSIVVDPWRRYANSDHRVVHYGRTR